MTKFGEVFKQDFERLARVVKGQEIEEPFVEDLEGYAVWVKDPGKDVELFFVPDEDTAEDLRVKLQVPDTTIEPIKAGQVLTYNLDPLNINFTTLDDNGNFVWAWPYEQQHALEQMIKGSQNA